MSHKASDIVHAQEVDVEVFPVSYADGEVSQTYRSADGLTVFHESQVHFKDGKAYVTYKFLRYGHDH